MNKTTVNFRADQVQAMHEVIKCANDEYIYASWITVVPDEPSRDDFKFIAESDDLYNEVVALFIKLVSRPGYKA